MPAKKSKKELLGIAKILSGIPNPKKNIKMGETITIRPNQVFSEADYKAMKKKPKGPVYIIDSRSQRLRRDAFTKNLAVSFEVIPGVYFTSQIVVSTPKGEPRNVFYVVDGQHRVGAIREQGLPKTFQAAIYHGTTPEQMRALFDLYSSVIPPNSDDRMAAHRDMSPAFLRYEEDLADKVILPCVLYLKSSTRKDAPPVGIPWKRVMGAWGAGVHNPPMTVTLPMGEVDKHPAHGFHGEKIEAIWLSNESVEAYECFKKVLWACFFAHEWGTTRNVDLDKAGKRLTNLMLSTSKTSQDRLLHAQKNILTWNKSGNLVRATRRDGPPPLIRNSFFGSVVIQVFFTLIYYNGWRTFLRCLPRLMADYAKVPYWSDQHRSNAKHIRDGIVNGMNHNAKKYRVLYPTPELMAQHRAKVGKRKILIAI